METKPMIDQALHHAMMHLHADSGTVHLREPGRDVLVLAAHHAIPETVLSVIGTIPWGKGMAGLAAERKAPIDACNLQTSTSTDIRPGARATGTQGALVVPMLLDGEVFGTFGVACFREREFTPDETAWLLDYASTLAARLSAAAKS
jgi:putative methionine-R-sulfoxide reductase with GAF domain